MVRPDNDDAYSMLRTTNGTKVGKFPARVAKIVIPQANPRDTISIK
jgi:hypothetical protein